MRSPSGGVVVPSSGPLDAEVVLIGESPAAEEVRRGEPFVGRAGVVLNKVVTPSGLERASFRILNLVPTRAPGDKFVAHDPRDLAWGRELLAEELAALTNPRVFVPLGENPLRWLCGLEGIGNWRGSLFPRGASLSAGYDSFLAQPSDVVVVPMYHPAAIAYQFAWHIWSLMDFRRVARFVGGTWKPPKQRTWLMPATPDDVEALVDEAISYEHLVSFDTETQPSYIVALTLEERVCAFEWSEAFREPLQRLFASKLVLKTAHNLAHDIRFLEKALGIGVEPPYFDTLSVHVIEPEAEKALSPHLSTRFTEWPYHKWLSDVDPLRYCGMDSVVGYDGYWGLIAQASRDGLLGVLEADHRLLKPLIHMQRVGVRIDVVERAEVLASLADKRASATSDFLERAAPLVRDRFDRLETPHLFRKAKRCACCGGGKSARLACWHCAGFEKKPGKRTLGAAVLAPCAACVGAGKVETWLPINPDSSAQVADILYRAAGIRPRSYKRAETVRRARLEPLASHPLVASYIAWNEANAEFETVERLEADADDRLHAVFNPWGTVSGRVASSEGLLDVGTNLMNLPYEARRLIVADPGCVLLYPDMEQIEARAVAVLSNDTAFRALFAEGRDSHNEVRALMASLGIELTRQQCKRLTYLAMYGGRAEHLAKELGIPLRLADAALQAFFRMFRGVLRWRDDVRASLRASRSLSSPTGRRWRWLGYIYNRREKDVDYEVLKKAWSRQPQDMAARVLSEGLCEIYEKHLALLLPLAHVHDAVLFQVERERLREGMDVAQRALSREMWGMHFPAGMSAGPNWYVASLDDTAKREAGYVEWTNDALLR